MGLYKQASGDVHYYTRPVNSAKIYLCIVANIETLARAVKG